MKLLYVILFIVISFHTTTIEAAEQKKKPIIIEEKITQEGEEKAWAIESVQRAQYLYPSNWGEAGIFRVRSAEGFPKGTLTFGIGGEFYSVTDAPTFGFGGSSAKTIAESLFIGYTPLERFTLSLMRRNSSTTFGNPQTLISSLGDMNLSALYSIPLTKMLAVAPFFDVLVASNFNNLAPAGSTVSVGLGAAFTASLYNTFHVPLWTHFNVIYHIPQIRTASPSTIAPESFFNFSRYHTLTLSLGAELKIGDLMPFLELRQTAHANSSLSYWRSPSTVSLGLRFTPLSNKSLAVLLGTDVALNRSQVAGVPFTPGYQILGQLSYTVGVSSTERKHYFTSKDVNIVDRKFILDKDVKFMLDSATLTQDSKPLLDEIAEVILKNDIQKLLIVGHTDSTHTEAYNLKLSRQRAQSVKSHLVTQNVPPKRLLIQGYGKRQPIASNLTEEGRAKNRRVAFFILE